jgi:hypothetical protein
MVAAAIGALADLSGIIAGTAGATVSTTATSVTHAG